MRLASFHQKLPAATAIDPEQTAEIASAPALNNFQHIHGDLHLANLFEWHGEVYPFDSLEFNPDLRWIDQVSDIAFLVMDLTVPTDLPD